MKVTGSSQKVVSTLFITLVMTGPSLVWFFR